jgi:hypothetical protein
METTATRAVVSYKTNPGTAAGGLGLRNLQSTAVVPGFQRRP